MQEIKPKEDNTDISENINKTIFSLEFGVGIITGVNKLEENGDEFFVISYGNKNIKNYIPVKGNKPFRFVSSPTSLNQAMDALTAHPMPTSFESKNERLHYFTELSKTQDLKSVVMLVTQMSQLDDLTPLENKLLKKLTESLLLEISFVFDINIDDAKKIILEKLSLNLKG